MDVQPTDWKLGDLELVFVACPREPNVLTATLASAFMADPAIHELKSISVVVDAPELGWIGPLSKQRQVCWLPRSSVQDLRASTYPIHQRASYNYWRALKSVSPGTRGLIVCEDDVILREGWLGKLMQSLQDLRQHSIHEFILALYSAYDHEEPHLRRGEFYSSYFARSFFGTQSMFFPAAQLSALREVIWRDSVETNRSPYDLTIAEYATVRQNLYTTRHSLAQHVGYQSTGLGSMHTSPSFERPWPGL